MLIQGVVEPRPDVLAEEFQGDLRAYRVGREAEADKLENNPELFFAVTYPSASLQRFVERVHQKLEGNRVQGAFLPIGRMGSGKTHALIALYHLFAHPELGRIWLQNHGLPALALDDSRAVMISAQEDHPEYLWEPLFRRADREDLLPKVKDYPTISLLRQLVGEDTLAVFVDEIENWYDSIASDEVRRGRNRGFLQNLTEVASEPGFNLFLFISLLDQNPDLKALLRRTGATSENMVAVGERWAIVRHRLFARCDEEKARKIVEAYLTSYGDYSTEDLSVETMLQLYPFHPSLFNTLKEIHARPGQQGIRDTLRTLAALVADQLDKRDLLLASDVPTRELLSIDPTLHTALQEDIERCREIKNADALLSTIFFYSLRPSMPGATLEELVQGLLRPEGSVNGITMPLKQLDGTAFHLKGNGRFRITPELNIYAIVRAEAGRVKDQDARARIDELIKKKVFGKGAYLFSELEDIDDQRLKVVVAPCDMDDEINAALGQLNWPNRVVLVVPKAFLGMKSVYEWGDNLENAKRVVAEERLLTGEQRDIEELREELLAMKNEEDLPRLIEDLRGAYGRYVQWMTSGRLSKRNVDPNVEVIKKRAAAGLDAAYDQILDTLEGQDFIEVKRLIDDFFRIRRYPIVKERREVEEALHQLYRDREIGFKGLKQNYLPGRDPFPLFAHEGLSIARYESLKQWEPEVEEGEEKPPSEGEGVLIYPSGGKKKRRVPEGEAVEGVPVSALESFTISGLTPLGLQELGPQDTVREVAIVVDERQLPLDKATLEKLIAGLPEGTAIRLKLKVVRRG
ncbi:MAG: DUF499 domain-containing protein [Chloroflexota bacterium]|nr:DUF499 domain-containing protein [Chloroflexota bacterium]